MTAIQTGAGIVELTFQHLLPAKFDSPAARVQLLANGLQESGFLTRQQDNGPARSYWQMEQGGGIHWTLINKTTGPYARTACSLRAVAPIESDVYAAFLSDDLLACVFARLLLWADPSPLPQLGDEADAFMLYLATWNPGAYARGDAGQRAEIEARFFRNYAAAVQAVRGH